jgi:hypothetical protein
MPKKRVAKKTTRKKTTKSPPKKTTEKILVENFVSLQKVMTELAIKFDGLGAQISKLLELFEISAKTLAEKEIKINANKTDKKEDKELAIKLDSLIDQNKIIARGLTLLHENPGEEFMPVPPPMPNMMPPQQINPPMQSPQLPPLNQNPGEYQKSQKPVRKKSPKKNETALE